ncbi:MAG: adenylate kinase [Phototrophicales bacterium]|nr:MAG: adenylate kinase [Phototrophicales bacterium]RMG70108.1 MAG: nucleoside monophosphate kinase [Chloroflexota bacterium]
MGLYLIIMGVQGAGKGTQAAFIQKTFNIPHVSTGDLFRAMKNRQDELAQRVQNIMNAGQLVPDDVTNEVLKDRLEQPDAQQGVILDGYPRNVAQASWLKDYLAQRGEKLAAVLLLDLDPYTAFKRAFGRVKSTKTGETYNIYTNNEGLTWEFIEHPEHTYPPRLEAKLKATGEILERRRDDEAFSVVKRIDTYLAETMPLVDYFRQQDVLYSIPADQPIDVVSQAVQQVIEKVK